MDLSMRVLVVDDFATMRFVIRWALKHLGFTNIIEADDGSAALRELKREKVGLILSDWKMPRMTGLDLLRAVRSDESLKDIPFIMVTAEGQTENVLEAVKTGVSSYIVKPFAPETLEGQIRKVLS